MLTLGTSLGIQLTVGKTIEIAPLISTASQPASPLVGRGYGRGMLEVGGWLAGWLAGWLTSAPAGCMVWLKPGIEKKGGHQHQHQDQDQDQDQGAGTGKGKGIRTSADTGWT
jgi:hypothetical protein